MNAGWQGARIGGLLALLSPGRVQPQQLAGSGAAFAGAARGLSLRLLRLPTRPTAF